jgi:acylphosphatase
MNAINLRITGHVQGVFFRDWTIREARALGLLGWVRNRADGAVELYAVGEDAALDTLEARCREGPAKARVKQVERTPADVEPNEGFVRRPTVLRPFVLSVVEVRVTRAAARGTSSDFAQDERMRVTRPGSPPRAHSPG